jgi:hypothetical protein
MITEIMSKDGGSKVVDLNRRKAVRERCLNCVGWEVQRVNGCEDTSCHPTPSGPAGAGRARRTGRGRSKDTASGAATAT